MVDFSYKLLNYLIQGSAADCTKEAVIQYNAAKKHGRFMVTVHDEINFSCAAEHIASELKILEDVMAHVSSYAGQFNVPMRSDAKTGPTWADLKKIEGK
jgi:DNA polymerase I-like protein with 3'-5' exonuclease and polymerase domains